MTSEKRTQEVPVTSVEPPLKKLAGSVTTAAAAKTIPMPSIPTNTMARIQRGGGRQDYHFADVILNISHTEHQSERVECANANACQGWSSHADEDPHTVCALLVVLVVICVWFAIICTSARSSLRFVQLLTALHHVLKHMQ
jgi:hypothetical protein